MARVLVAPSSKDPGAFCVAKMGWDLVARVLVAPPSKVNVIETAWHELRARLYAAEPKEREGRAAFVARLRSAVAWVNRNRQSYLRERCFAQKERARDVIALNGGRTKH